MENAFPKSIKSARQDWKFYLRVLQLHASVNSVPKSLVFIREGGVRGAFFLYTYLPTKVFS